MELSGVCESKVKKGEGVSGRGEKYRLRPACNN
jgi:hypothetical protein